MSSFAIFIAKHLKTGLVRIPHFHTINHLFAGFMEIVFHKSFLSEIFHMYCFMPLKMELLNCLTWPDLFCAGAH